jgi:ParB-like chromosome segregation protein Spo0J
MTATLRKDVTDGSVPEHTAAASEPGPELSCHALAKLFPPLKGKAFTKLKENIRKHGQKDPVTVHEGQILDGRAVYRACRELGVSPRIQPWDGKGSVLDFIVARNLHRRHLSTRERSTIAAKLVRQLGSEGATPAGSGKSTATRSRANLPAGRGRDRAAAALQVSPRSVESAGTVLEKGVPALAKAMEEGQVAVSSAALVAGLPAAEQEEVVARGPQAVRQKGSSAAKNDFEKRAHSRRGRSVYAPPVVHPARHSRCCA